PFFVEGATRRQPHHEERHGGNQQQCRYGSKQALDGKLVHAPQPPPAAKESATHPIFRIMGITDRWPMFIASVSRDPIGSKGNARGCSRADCRASQPLSC